MMTPNSLRHVLAAVLCLAAFLPKTFAQAPLSDPRLAWWSQARFGMFIHFGLYAVPGGKWGDKTSHGEWIRDTAKIPVAEYEKLLGQFNPTGFDAEQIVLAAKNAGMKYIVITSKHHDGFCLFDSKVTDWDVMSTPFNRDIMKEMADACHKHGVKICWYYSIMDWHHPDYLPRRPWEKDRTTEGADFDRYVAYMKAQLKELLTNYGEIGVLWFDGQWEHNWTDERGRDLYAYVRGLQPNIVINSRVGRAGGDFGLDRQSGMLGDYGTPEQTIPEFAIPDMPWETCMTMNGHWGYNAADKNFKTSEDLIRKLADIASKGGNFLLNVGPTGEGKIPATSIERLKEMGEWMKVNGESIYGTVAGPMPLAWGCVTRADAGGGNTRLYVHVNEPPKDGVLVLPGLLNTPVSAGVLGGGAVPADKLTRKDDAVVIASPGLKADSVVRLDIQGTPDVAIPPTIKADAPIFVGSTTVTITSDRKDVEVRATIDGTDPVATSPIASTLTLKETATVAARCFRVGKAVSPVAKETLTRVKPTAAVNVAGAVGGLKFTYAEGAFKTVAELMAAKPASSGTVATFDYSGHKVLTDWGFVYSGYVKVPADGVYRFTLGSDDGSMMWVGGKVLIDNDKPHSYHERTGDVALAAGLHPIKVAFFENSGGFELKVKWSGGGVAKQEIPASAFFRDP